MGFGHRNCVVACWLPKQRKLSVNNWSKQTCTVHACLKPRKAKKSGEDVFEVLVEQEIPNHTDTGVSENTATATETTANSGNCSTAPEAEFFVNNCCPDKDLRIQEIENSERKTEKRRGKERT